MSNYESKRRILGLRTSVSGAEGTASVKSTQRTIEVLQKVEAHPPFRAWSGYTSCHARRSIIAYTTGTTFFLTIGKSLYLDPELLTPYYNGYFMHQGIRYTTMRGIIWLAEPCNPYMV